MINLISQYKAYLERAGKSTHTIRAYCADLAGFVAWFEQTAGSDFAPQSVDARDLQDYRSYLSRQGKSVATINRRLVALSRFFRWAKDQQLITETPFGLLDRVQVREQKDVAPHWLDQNDQLALLRAVRRAKSLRDLAIVQTLLGAGLRISELAQLNLSDLEISERKGWIRVRQGKGSKAREIPLDNRTRTALADYLAERAQETAARLFLGQRGPLNERGIDYLVRKYAYQAKLHACTAHTLRHSFAKNLVDTGTPLDQVATLLGHESLDTTRVYVRPSRQDLEQAVRRAAGELP